MRTNPFPEGPPRFLRGLLYHYRFTTPEERRQTGAWWMRELVRVYLPPVSLQAQEWRRPGTRRERLHRRSVPA